MSFTGVGRGRWLLSGARHRYRGAEAHLPRGVYTQKKKNAVSGADPLRGFQVSFRQPAPVEELHGLSATGSLRNRMSPRLLTTFLLGVCLHSLLSTQMSRRWTADTMSLGLRRRLQQFLLRCDVMFMEVSPLTVFTS